jgi:hypothetical protein
MKTLNLLIALFFISSLAVASPIPKYNINQHPEFKLLSWGQTKKDIEKVLNVSLQQGKIQNVYVAQKEYKNMPANYIFTLNDDGLQSIVVVVNTPLSQNDWENEIGVLKNLYNEPSSQSKNVYQWKDAYQEISIMRKPDNTVILGARKIPITVNPRKYGPEKYSPFQGLNLGMSVNEFQKSFTLAPLEKVNADMYLAHITSLNESAIVTFAFRENKLILISLQLSKKKSQYEDCKNFFVRIYGTPTTEDALAMACLWRDGEYNTILMWRDQTNAFSLIYRIGF